MSRDERRQEATPPLANRADDASGTSHAFVVGRLDPSHSHLRHRPLLELGAHDPEWLARREVWVRRLRTGLAVAGTAQAREATTHTPAAASRPGAARERR